MTRGQLSVVLAFGLGMAQTAAAEEIRANPVGGADAAAGASGEAATDRSPIDGVLGHYGIGYFTSSAPIGGRLWTERDTAWDLGLDLAFSSGDLEAYRYGVEVGYVKALAHYHYSVVFARAGFGFRYLDTFGSASTKGRYDLNLNGFVGAELFLGAFGFPNVSLQGGYGLQAAYTYQRGSALIIGTVPGGLSVISSGTVGFHIYL